MAAAQSVPSEVEKSEHEDPVKEVIHLVAKALLQEEERARTSDMLEYRNNLSRHLLKLGLDTNIPKNALKIYPEILNFFPKNPSKNL